MKDKIKFIIIAIGILIAIFLLIVLIPKKATSPANKIKASVTPSSTVILPSSTPASTPNPSQNTISKPAEEPNGLIEPVIDFKSRVTKKPFGIYITPQNSPVQPEKFTGYHTGADAEYGDVDTDTPFYAVSDGTVEFSGHVNGYGGVLIIKHNINGQEILCLYGHVAISSIPPKGTSITKGQTLGRLGHAYSSETDGERKHLHFAMLKGSQIDYRGYVQSQSELSGWYDPLTFFTK